MIDNGPSQVITTLIYGNETSNARFVRETIYSDAANEADVKKWDLKSLALISPPPIKKLVTVQSENVVDDEAYEVFLEFKADEQQARVPLYLSETISSLNSTNLIQRIELTDYSSTSYKLS